MKRKKRDIREPERGAPGWMVTYGDLMTLLLVFFVMIATFSSIQLSKFKQAMGSLKGALGVLKAGQVTTESEQMQLTDAVKALRRFIELEDFGQTIRLEESPRGMIITISNPVLFDLGKAEIKPQVYPLLDKIASIAKDSWGQIKVEGHTDDLPISTPRFPSNWELSTSRAVNVLRYFIEEGGLEPERLSAVGYGEYHPLFPNDTEEHRARNRRVVIRIEY